MKFFHKNIYSVMFSTFFFIFLFIFLFYFSLIPSISRKNYTFVLLTGLTNR